MNFTKTTSEDFVILKNGVDERIEFIKHTETGFYNITKARNVIQELKNAENRLVGNPTNPIKPTKHWFLNAAAQELIEEVKRQTGRNEVKYNLHTGTQNEFKGTYVHELLVDHFLIWLDPKYGVKVSIILRELHENANRKVIKEKDDKIDTLTAKIDQMSFEQRQLILLNQDQTNKINQKLKSYDL